MQDQKIHPHDDAIARSILSAWEQAYEAYETARDNGAPIHVWKKALDAASLFRQASREFANHINR